MKKLATLLLLICALPAFAQTNFFATYSFVNGFGQPQNIKQISLTPLSFGLLGTNLVVGDTNSVTITSNSITLPLLTGFAYKVQYYKTVQPPVVTAIFTNWFPTNIVAFSTVQSSAYLAISTNLGNGIYALTKAQADLLYSPIGSGGGSATNVNFYQGNNTLWRLVNGSNVVDVVGKLTNDTTGNAGSATTAANLSGTITLSQVSNAGTAAYSNAAAFDLAGTAKNATNVLAAPALVGIEPLAVVNPAVVTNVNTFLQWVSFSTFAAGPSVNTVWDFAGTSTNISIVSSNGILTDTNVYAVRDPFQFKWIDNNHNVFYLMSYGAYYNSTETSNQVGIAQSYDGGKSYHNLAYLNFGSNHFAQWSSKLAANSTNGLNITVGLGDKNALGPTNNFICDLALNFTNYSNLRTLGQRGVGGSENEQSSGELLYSSGMYNYFDSVGQQFTNSTLGPSGWTWANNDGTFGWNWGSAGPTVQYFNGVWYWFTTDIKLIFITSPDLVHWTGVTGQPIFFPPYDGYSQILSSFQEGSAIVDNYATPPPISSGVFSGTHIGSGAGLTNQGYARILTSTNGIWTPTVNAIDGSTNWSFVLTNVPAAQITGGPLPAMSGANLTSLTMSQVSGTLPSAQLPYVAQGGNAQLTNVANGFGPQLSAASATNLWGTLSPTNMPTLVSNCLAVPASIPLLSGSENHWLMHTNASFTISSFVPQAAGYSSLYAQLTNSGGSTIQGTITAGYSPIGGNTTNVITLTAGQSKYIFVDSFGAGTNLCDTP